MWPRVSSHVLSCEQTVVASGIDIACELNRITSLKVATEAYPHKYRVNDKKVHSVLQATSRASSSISCATTTSQHGMNAWSSFILKTTYSG